PILPPITCLRGRRGRNTLSTVPLVPGPTHTLGAVPILPAITCLRGRHTLLAVPSGPGRAHPVGRRSGHGRGANPTSGRRRGEGGWGGGAAGGGWLPCTAITGGRHAGNVGLRRRLGVGASPAQIQRRPIGELAGGGCHIAMCDVRGDRQSRAAARRYGGILQP